MPDTAGETKDTNFDIELDNFSKDQLRQLLDDDDYNEEAIEFSDDGDTSMKDYNDSLNEDTYGYEEDDDDVINEDEEVIMDDDSDESDYEDSSNSRENRYKTLADLGFTDNEAEDEQISDNDSDDEFIFRNALREVKNFRTISKKKGPKKVKSGLAALRRRIRRTEVTPEIKVLLSKANEAFVDNDLDAALKWYSEVIKKDRNNFSAYKSLGEIYRMNNDLNKCSNIWLLAAHLNPGDTDFWKTVAELSVELGHFKQGIYCYRRAITASGGKDYDAIFSRACLYREVHKFKRASSALIRLRSLLPHDSRIVRELAKVYVEENRVNDAISLYTKILDDNVKYRKLLDKGENVELDNILFEWSELNILSELYASKAAWVLGIKSLRQISRWIQERESQSFWDDNLDNDIEFDDRRNDDARFQKLKRHEKSLDYTLPIDIRVQLGIFRLNNKNEDEALSHFAILLEQEIEDTPDLFYKVGMELESFALYKDALEFLIPLSYYEEYNTSELVGTIAKCLRETEDFENAKETYIRLLDYDPENVELKVALAECYFYLGNIDSANILYKEARLQRSKEKAASAKSNLTSHEDPKKLFEDDEDEDVEEAEDIVGTQAIIQDIPLKSRRKKKIVYTEEELQTMSVKSELRTKKQYGRSMKLLVQLETLKHKSKKNESDEFSLKTLAGIWIEMVSDLIEIFAMYKWFFSSEKAKKFNMKLRLRTAKLGIDEKISRMKYLQKEIILSQHFLSMPFPKQEFKGLTYDQWYELFAKYALFIAEFENDIENSSAIFEIIKQVNVFKGNELATSLIGLSIGILTSNTSFISTQTRNIMNDHQFAIDGLRLYLSSIITTYQMEMEYADAPSQKFMLRQIKAFDYLKSDDKDNVVGKANITKTNVDVTKEHFLINYIYASYLFTNKSYYSAIIYLLKLYQVYPNNPDLLLLLALSNFHRSVQRKTLNTSFQILQGLTFLVEYIKSKDQNDIYNQMEAFYNVGRSFHLLGLDHLATKFYERVLEIEVDDPSYDLKWEAAHNLCIIYNLNQNYKEAEKIMDKYLVI